MYTVLMASRQALLPVMTIIIIDAAGRVNRQEEWGLWHESRHQLFACSLKKQSTDGRNNSFSVPKIGQILW